jgi:GNAT superfamily N-acetyltransferase
VITVEVVAAEVARDEGLVEELARLVNGAYAVGEAGLWLEGATRTTSAEISGAIRDGQLLAATAEGRVVGCANVHLLDKDTADLSLISAERDHWGGGVGRALVDFAEELMRSRGVTTMQLELLVPKGSTHPEKQRLHDWYTRLGYRVTRTAPFDEVAGHLTHELAGPCEFLIFHKPLITQHDRAVSSEEPERG